MTNNIVTSATLAEFYKESNIEAVKVLGSGSYSTVVLAKYPKLAATHPLIAIKNIDRRQAGDYVKRFLPRELEIVKAIQHPNICSVLEVIEHNHYLCFLTELCDGGDLLEKINAAKRIPETEGKVLFRQLIEALSYLVENEIVHRDLKCENIFLDKDQNIKLGDFGFARYLRTGEKSKTFCGSRAYVAPEILRSVEYSGHTVDIWSSGVVLFVMLTGMMPYDERNVQKMIDTQLKHKVKFPRSVDLSVEARTLIYEILHPHPVSRPTCQQIKLSEWLKATPYVIHKAKKVSVSLPPSVKSAPSSSSSTTTKPTPDE